MVKSEAGADTARASSRAAQPGGEGGRLPASPITSRTAAGTSVALPPVGATSGAAAAAAVSVLCQITSIALDTILATRTLALWRAAQTGFEFLPATEYEKQNTAIGRFVLAIFGKTGVGKST